MEPIQVLIIDPEQTTRDQLRSALNVDQRVELHLSSSAEGAAELLKRKTQWHVIILNSWLPGQDAFSFIQDWKERDSKTQFILLSQDASKAELVKALRLGILDYFEKPLPVQDVKNSMDRLLQKMSLENSRGLAPVISLPSGKMTDTSTPASLGALSVAPRLRLVGSEGVTSGLSPVTPSVDASAGASYTDMKRRWIETFEVEYLSRLLDHHEGNVSAAAREAKLDRSNFLRLLRKYGLKAEVYRGKLAA